MTTKDGVVLWCEAIGNSDDPAVLLIMGAMNQAIFWPDDFCERLSQSGFYVIRYDHRDTGKSTKMDFEKTPYNLDVLASDGISIFEAFHLKAPVLVGLSMGGYIAQLIAAQCSNVQKMVLISTSADHRPYMTATMGQESNQTFQLPSPEAKLLDYIKSCTESPPKTKAEIEDNLLQGWAVTYGGKKEFPRRKVAEALRLAATRLTGPNTAYNHALAVARSMDRLELVRSITAKTLVIHGRYDPCLPLPHGEYLADNIPDARLQVLEMGHSFMWSYSDEVLSSIVVFLQESLS